MPQIVIIGAGALGGVIAAQVAPHAQVTLIDGWVEHVAAINAHGLICERDDQIAVQAVRAVTDPALVEPVDLALVLVKAQQTPWAAAVAQQILRPTGVAYTLQNGLGNAALLAATLGTERVGQGVTALGATLLGPGRVRWAGRGATVFANQPVPAHASALVDSFTAAGLPASVGTDVDALVWGKLLANVAINPLTALLRVPNGALLTQASLQPIWQAAVLEAAAVAAAQGIVLPYADPLAHVQQVIATTAANRSSMLQDLLRGAPTEIATINGAIVALGQRYGIPTPVNATLTALIRAL